MSDLIYPNLFLFLYDLREGLGDSQDNLDKNRSLFAAKLPESLRGTLFLLDNDFETDSCDLLPNRTEKFPDKDKPFEGYYYPVRLNDTYGLLVACSFPKNNTLHPAECIAKFKAIIETKLNGNAATIGQTWVIFAQVANPHTNAEEIAKKCCEKLQLDLNWERDLQGQGRFFGGNLFELWRYRLAMKESAGTSSPDSQPTIQQIQQSHHAIVALFPDEMAAGKAIKLYLREWMGLFGYRHKIFWAYGQSRYLKQQIKKDFIAIQAYIKSSKSDSLKQRRKILTDAQKTLSSYAIAVTNFADQLGTIDINLLDYNRRVKRLEKIAEEASIQSILPDRLFPGFLGVNPRTKGSDRAGSSFLSQMANWQHPSDLKFLENFGEDIANKYQLQLQKDIENLSPGLNLLENLINTTRGITEIEQAQRDRNFQTWVGIFGVGLGAGSFAASVSGNFPHFDAIAYKGKNKAKELQKYPVESFLSQQLRIPDAWLVSATLSFYCLAVALFAGAIAAILIKGWWFVRKLPARSR